MGSTDESHLPIGCELNAYDLKETYVESYTESLTHAQFSKQGFLEDVEYDDTALEEMLHNAHRVHVYHSQREGLSVGQSSSSVSKRTGRPVEERTGRPVEPICQELNTEHAQIRTLLDRQKEQILAECQAEIKKHEFQAGYDRRSVSGFPSITQCDSNREYDQNPGFQCFIVTKTEGHGLLELDPLRSQAPSSCEHPFPFLESVLSNQEA